ncbi:unnamed protein product [Mucor hiemalis]
MRMFQWSWLETSVILENERAVSREKGMSLSQQWGGKPFYETSAHFKINVMKYFTM